MNISDKKVFIGLIFLVVLTVLLVVGISFIQQPQTTSSRADFETPTQIVDENGTITQSGGSQNLPGPEEGEGTVVKTGESGPTGGGENEEIPQGEMPADHPTTEETPSGGSTTPDSSPSGSDPSSQSPNQSPSQEGSSEEESQTSQTESTSNSQESSNPTESTSQTTSSSSSTSQTEPTSAPASSNSTAENPTPTSALLADSTTTNNPVGGGTSGSYTDYTTTTETTTETSQYTQSTPVPTAVKKQMPVSGAIHITLAIFTVGLLVMVLGFAL